MHNNWRKAVCLTGLFTWISFFCLNAQNYTSTNGKIKFTSEAPLELIKAGSSKMISVLSTSDRRFAFSVLIETFEGFNSPLQKEHFRENYMETTKFKTATFKGKIIEEVDLSKAGTYNVRAKGMFTIHGVEKEKIIKAKVVVKDGSMNIESDFTVPLDEFNIKVPKVVNQKIASVIAVNVDATLLLK